MKTPVEKAVMYGCSIEQKRSLDVENVRRMEKAVMCFPLNRSAGIGCIDAAPRSVYHSE